MTSATLDAFRVQRFFSLIDDPFPLAPLSLIGIAILSARFGDKILKWDKDRGGFWVGTLGRGSGVVWLRGWCLCLMVRCGGGGKDIG